MITMKFYTSSTVNDPRSPIFPVESWKKNFQGRKYSREKHEHQWCRKTYIQLNSANIMTSTDLFSAMHGLAQESYLILLAIRDLFQIFMILRVLNLQTLAIGCVTIKKVKLLDNLPVSPSINFVTL